MRRRLEKTASGMLPEWLPGWVMPVAGLASVAESIRSNLHGRKLEKKLQEHQKKLIALQEAVKSGSRPTEDPIVKKASESFIRTMMRIK